MLGDPNARTVRPAFDHVRLAAALSLAADTSYVAEKLPFTRLDLSDGGRSMLVEIDTTRAFSCDMWLRARASAPTAACRTP